VCKRFLEICAALVACQLPFAQLIQLPPRTADRQVVALANRFTTVIGLSEAALESMRASSTVTVPVRLELLEMSLTDYTTRIRYKIDVTDELTLSLAITGQETSITLHQDDLGANWPILLYTLMAGEGLPDVQNRWFYNCNLGEIYLQPLLEIAIPSVHTKMKMFNIGKNNLSMPSANKIARWLQQFEEAGSHTELDSLFIQQNEWGSEGI